MHAVTARALYYTAHVVGMMYVRGWGSIGQGRVEGVNMNPRSRPKAAGRVTSEFPRLRNAAGRLNPKAPRAAARNIAQCEVLEPPVSTQQSSAIPANPSGVSGTVLSSLPGLKTCPKCEHLVKQFSGDSIHSTLAYSRCRCHRLFVHKMKELQLQFAREQAKRASQHEAPVYPSPQKTVVSSDSEQSGPLSAHVQPTSTLLHADREEHLKRQGDIHVAHRQPQILRLNFKQSSSSHQSLPSSGTSVSNLRVPMVAPCSLVAHQKSQKDLLKSSASKHRLQTSVLFEEPSIVRIKSVQRLPPLNQVSTKDVNNLLQQSSVHHHQHLDPSGHISSSPRKTRSSEMTDMLKYIPTATQQMLRRVFKQLDKNEDGHLTFSEFWGGLPFKHPGSDVEYIIKQLYQTTSEFTYFGCREFIVCYCVAEVLVNSRLVADHRCTVVFDKVFIQNVLKPYLGFLSERSLSGHVSFVNIMDSITCLNKMSASSKPVSVVVPRLEKVIKPTSSPVLDLIALAPYYMSYTAPERVT